MGRNVADKKKILTSEASLAGPPSTKATYASTESPPPPKPEDLSLYLQRREIFLCGLKDYGDEYVFLGILHCSTNARWIYQGKSANREDQ